MKNSNNFAGLIEAFFTDRLMQQRQASPNTISSYRDTFCLLFKFAKQRLKKRTLGPVDQGFGRTICRLFSQSY